MSRDLRDNTPSQTNDKSESPSSLTCQMNFGRGICLVKMSAVWFGSRQLVILINPSFTSSLTQCHRMSTCLVRLWNWGFLAIDIDPSLSPRSRIGSLWMNPNSPYRCRIHVASQAASDSATYSASVDDRAIVDCFLDPQVIAPLLDRNTYPEIDFWSSAFAKVASENP